MGVCVRACVRVVRGFHWIQAVSGAAARANFGLCSAYSLFLEFLTVSFSSNFAINLS